MSSWLQLRRIGYTLIKSIRIVSALIMMRYLVGILFLFASLELQAQIIGTSLVGSSGETSTTGDLTVNWSIGEVIVEPVEFNGAITVSQGMHHAVLTVTAIDPIQSLNRVKIFPNPTADYLTIALKDTQQSNIILYDLNGNTIFNRQNPQGTLHRIDLTQYKDGIYILTINSNQDSHQEKFKIVKSSVK